MEFKPNLTPKWKSFYFFIIKLGEPVTTIWMKINYIFIFKINVYGYFASYSIIFNVIDKTLFFIKKPNFIIKIILFIFIFICSFIWLFIAGIFLPIYYTLTVSFDEWITLVRIYKSKDWRQWFLVCGLADRFDTRYVNYYLRFSISKSKENIWCKWVMLRFVKGYY